MTNSPTDLDSARVEQILEHWFEQQSAGEHPDLEQLCAGCPELIPRVREMLERYDAMLGVEPRTEPTRQPMLVDRLGDFELKSRIGSGGMGDVYLAREISLDRMVAVKVLRRELADDPLRRLRFKREAQLTAALDHPNIVPIYGTGEDQGYLFLVMKHLAGATLDRVEGEWTPKRAAMVGAQVARALHAAHEVGIVHRDIKPGNIQLDGDDAYVLDFGLARGRVDLTLTTEGQAPGTLAYMPPEQLTGTASAVDPRGDIYSLGATLYQCVTGHPPFEDDTPEVLVRRALIHDPEPLGLDAPNRDLETIVFRALEKDPSRRFPSALEFADDLDRFLGGEPIQSRPPSTLTRMIKLARRHRVKTAVLATALIVSLILGVALWRGAAERAADVERQFGLVASAVDEGRPAHALQRLNELRENLDASGTDRFRELEHITHSTIAREALLDRVQLDARYQHHPLESSLRDQMEQMHPRVRSEPLTAVAFAFLAHHAGDLAAAREHLGQLGGANGFPRLCATFVAYLDETDPVAALVGLPGATSVEDHVFTAALLRIADAPPDAVRTEIEAARAIQPDHLRARMMIAVQHESRGDTVRAREVLTMLWDTAVPRPEMHSMIARLALFDGDVKAAQRHFEVAERDLERTSRGPILRLAVGRAVLAIMRGELVSATGRLAAARQQFGGGEWLDVTEARLRLAQKDYDGARVPLQRAAENARIPWNQRRARLALLDLDVEDFLASPWTGPASLAAAEGLRQRCSELVAAAEQAGDARTTANAYVHRYEVEELVFRVALQLYPNEAIAWEGHFLASLTAALKADDLHPAAASHMAAYVVNRVLAPATTLGQDLALGAAAGEAGQRALAVAQRAFRNDQPFSAQFETAACAAILLTEVGAKEDAEAAGAIANHFLAGLDDAQRAELDVLVQVLTSARDKLGLDAWPAPR